MCSLFPGRSLADASFMKPYNLVCHGEPKACAAAGVGGIRLVKALENF